jgi:monovalent cation:H+ antiporter-2, CPA2 family
VFAASSTSVAATLVELGAVILVLAVLARLADRVGLSPIPAYLLAGLGFGEGGLISETTAEDFIEIAAEIGVVLLLFTLGLEYTSTELTNSLRRGSRVGIADVVLNGTPGVVPRCSVASPSSPRRESSRSCSMTSAEPATARRRRS